MDDKHFWFILNDANEPVKATRDEFISWMQNGGEKQRIIAQDNLPGGIFISTVFLMIDHGFNDDPNAAPVLFETMVFEENDGNKYDITHEQERYTNMDDAIRGHKYFVKKYEKRHERN